MVFESKVDTWLVVVIAAAVGLAAHGGFADGATNGDGLVSAAVGVVFLVAIVAGVAFPCRYVLESHHLFIQSGLFFRQRIPYREITAVEPSSNPLAAPALSLRRVKVTYGRKWQLVSPRERDEFIVALRARVLLARAPGAPSDSSC